MAKINFGRWLSNVANVATLWPLIIPAGVVGVLLAWASHGVSSISSYGIFGWLVVALLGTLVAALCLYLIAKAAAHRVHAAATRKWAAASETVNPMARDFAGQRIEIADIPHPATRTVGRRRFTDCEIIGPANILLVGNGIITSCAFVQCDVVILNQDINVPIHNVVILEECAFLNCEFIRCTFFLVQQVYEQSFKSIGVVPISHERPST